MTTEKTPPSTSVDSFVIVPRLVAQETVDAVTFKVEQYSAVSFEDCLRLLGSVRFLAMRADPIRRLGPVAETVYPWNLVDYMSCENPRGKAR
jgi:hypothetical protein